MPAQHAPRKVLIHLEDDFHTKIHDLVKQGVLEKEEHSTEWVNSFGIVEKDVSIDSEIFKLQMTNSRSYKSVWIQEISMKH